MKHIRTLGFTSLVFGFFFFSALPSPAQASMAEDVGKKLIEGILSQALGIGADTLFGGPQAATKEEVREVVSEELGNYRVGTISAEASGLAKSIGAYLPSDTPANRENPINDIVTSSGDLQGLIEQAIENEGKFWDAFPHYIFASNVRLAFLAERVTIKSGAAVKKDAADVVASQAKDAIKKVYDFFKYDFVDHRHIQCLQRKDKRATFFNRNGDHVEDKWTHNGTGVCITDLRYKAAKMFLGPDHMMIDDRRVFKRPGHNEWYFNYKFSPTDNGDGGYSISAPYPSQEAAEYARIKVSVDKYPKQLGENYVDSIKGWMKIVEKSGNQTFIHDAREYMRKMGLL